jgi:hypothetical protein
LGASDESRASPAAGYNAHDVRSTDFRKPSEVTADFRARLALILAPHGFASRAKGARFVRKRGRNLHTVSLGSSHHNTPGDVTCFVSVVFDDAATRAQHHGWRAGGGFNLSAFDSGSETAANIAQPEQAGALIEQVLSRLAFFDLLESPGDLLRAVCKRYVPGILDPLLIVPYLRVHLGSAAVLAYARALLGARGELWPAFVAAPGESIDLSAPAFWPDHGSQLGVALAGREQLDSGEIPTDLVLSAAREGRALRSHYGLQLRAWGEPAAAALLRRVGDDALLQHSAEQKQLSDPTVHSRQAARLTLKLATGEARDPARSQQSPLFYQYYAAHGDFASAGWAACRKG